MPTTPERSSDDIVVVSPSHLVAQTVRVALIGSGLPARDLPWSSDLERREVRRAAARRGAGRVLLVVLDPPTRRATRDARALLQRSPVPAVVVIGGVAEGPSWGAMLEAGADVVLPAATTLGELLDTLGDPDAARGRLGDAARRRLVTAWREAEVDKVALVEGFESLSRRERRVLQLLHAGASVPDIAADTGLSASTIRRVVRSALRKLGVESRLAAVAIYERLVQDDPGPGDST